MSLGKTKYCESLFCTSAHAHTHFHLYKGLSLCRTKEILLSMCLGNYVTASSPRVLGCHPTIFSEMHKFSNPSTKSQPKTLLF